MKTETEIRARINELAEMLKHNRRELEAATTIEQIDQIAAKNRRIEGNIGSLEWVVRQDVHAGMAGEARLNTGENP